MISIRANQQQRLEPPKHLISLKQLSVIELLYSDVPRPFFVKISKLKLNCTCEVKNTNSSPDIVCFN